MKTQLLCTFCREAALDSTLKKITEVYNVAFDSIYVLENTDISGELCCTYNVVDAKYDIKLMPQSTISLHRKKATNTLYTINALNMLVSELNHGVIDVSFKVPWENYSNSILVTAYGKMKKIPTKLRNIVKVTEIE